ncbi:hypothetical protein IJG72_04845 [bacterium]|nr:hypothetical protein [bacterium]
MSIQNVIKRLLSFNKKTPRRGAVGLSCIKSATKTIENATAHIPSIRTTEIKLSDLMRRTNIY